MKKYTIEDFINKDLIFVGNYIQSKHIAKMLNVRGINTRALDSIVRVEGCVRFSLYVNIDELILSFVDDIQASIIGNHEYEIIHYEDIVIQDNTFKNEIHVSEFVKGNVAIKYNNENAIETLETLFKNGFHFYSTSDNEAIENMKNHIEYVEDEDKACPMDVFFLPVAKNIVENSCIVYDLYSKSLKYSLQKDMLDKEKTLCKISVIDFGLYQNDKPKFCIYEAVHINDEVRSYTGLIVNIDDINNEYEIAYSIEGKHRTRWVQEKYIFKVNDHCRGCKND